MFTRIIPMKHMPGVYLQIMQDPVDYHHLCMDAVVGGQELPESIPGMNLMLIAGA